MFQRMLGAAALAGVVGLAVPASAVTINLTVSDGGIERGQVCTAVTCGLGPPLVPWQDNSLYGATGTVTIVDDASDTLSFSLFVDSSSISGAAINGVTALTFDDTTYTATNIAVTAAPGMLAGTTVYTIAAGQNIEIDVTSLIETGGSSGAYDRAAVRVTGSCTIGGGTQVCGFTIGAAGAPGDPSGRYYVGAIDGFDLERYVRQTINVALVPEPTTVALLGLGLLGLAAKGRARQR